MQVMIQLALLAHSPIGTKISVNSNILTIQPPTYFQGMTRWWNNDNKDDTVKFLETLEEDDDVQNVYTNLKF